MEAVFSPTRFKVIVASRRIGKTFNALIWLVMQSLQSLDTLWKNWYIAPTYKEAKDIAWDLMKYICRNFIKKVNESTLEITLINDNKIALKGADYPDSLRGRPINTAVCDEFGTMKSNVFDEILRPSVSDTSGSIMFIGTPKGANHFRDLFLRADVLEDFEAFGPYKAIDSPFIPDEEIQKAKLQLLPALFRQEYEASFESFEGQLFRQEDLDNACTAGNLYGNFRSPYMVRAWDLATTTKTYSDYTAGGLYGRELDRLHALDMVRGKWEYPEAKQVILQTAEQDGILVPIIIESVGGFKAVFQDIKSELKPLGFRVLEEKRTKTGDKMSFAMPILAQSRTGKLILHPFRNRSDVVTEWLSLSCDVREWIHDDTLDTASMAHSHLFKKTITTGRARLGGERSKRKI